MSRAHGTEDPAAQAWSIDLPDAGSTRGTSINEARWPRPGREEDHQTRHTQRELRIMIARTLRTLVAIGALTVVLLNAGCIAYRPLVTRPPTLGSELISLDEARSTGLLTDDEHARHGPCAVLTQ